MRRNLFLTVLLFVMVAFIGESSLARADSISPSSLSAIGPTGFSVTVSKSVTISGTDGDNFFDTFETYSSVSIDTTEVPAEIGVAVAPGSYIGQFDRTIDRIFGFDVTFTDLEPGTHTFNIYVLVDGQFRVATESDTITSVDGKVPEPTTMLLLGSGLLGLWRFRKKFQK